MRNHDRNRAVLLGIEFFRTARQRSHSRRTRTSFDSADGNDLKNCCRLYRNVRDPQRRRCVVLGKQHLRTAGQWDKRQLECSRSGFRRNQVRVALDERKQRVWKCDQRRSLLLGTQRLRATGGQEYDFEVGAREDSGSWLVTGDV